MRKFVLLGVLILALHYGAILSAQEGQSDPGDKCLSCHQKGSPGLYNQWAASRHAQNDVGCIECHAAEESDPDAFKHGGALIATLVTPKDCGQCHDREAEETGNSYHATAGEILESNDAYLAHVAGGLPAVITGCESCHGAVVKLDPDSPNKLSLETWPNSGIGRINPDGSKGSCVACHSRHAFSKAQARQPESCSKCHLGPDHPQKEVYEESKHGNAYFTSHDKMNLAADSWIVGIDYSAAPTCTSCHMSATQKQPLTHDVGKRISWTLRPLISVKKEGWEEKRKSMLNVCSACHGKRFPQNHFYQFDALVRLYNQKFAQPASEVMDLLKKNQALEKPASFSNRIEWTFWELWHHEGRRARHGAAMMGPDYTWWHGIYEVAQHFYFKFIPEALEYDDPQVNAYIEQMLTGDPMHAWLSRPTAEIKADIRSGRIQDDYKRLFEKK
jgi:hypothetical protein